MFRPNLRNRTFEWMGERWAPIINPYHFLGRTPFDIRWHLDKPPLNLLREKELFLLEIPVPGYTGKEITISVRDDLLIIEGKKKKARRTPQSRYVVKEFDWDTFERRFELSEGAGHEKIRATCKNGMLRLTFTDVPKEQEEAYKKVTVE